MAARRTIDGFALRILCALALLFVSFAHQPPAVPANAAEAVSAAYMLPDGTFADLCLSDQAHDPGAKGIAKSGCEVCRLSASVILPQPSDCGFPVSAPAHMAFSLRPFSGISQPVLHAGASPRGPPLIPANI